MERDQANIYHKVNGVTTKHCLLGKSTFLMDEQNSLKKLFSKSIGRNINTDKTIIENTIELAKNHDYAAYLYGIQTLIYGTDEDAIKVAKLYAELSKQVYYPRKEENLSAIKLMKENEKFFVRGIKSRALYSHFLGLSKQLKINELILLFDKENDNDNAKLLLERFELDPNSFNDTLPHYKYIIDLLLYITMSERKINSLCWDNCENARADKCPKIRDSKKQAIQKYNFIKDGYQIVQNNKLQSFVVSGCSHYKQEERQKVDPQKLRHLKESIYEYYINSEDPKTSRGVKDVILKLG